MLQEAKYIGKGFTMSNLMKGKVFGLSMPNKKTSMAPHLHNVIPKVNCRIT